MMGLMQNFPLVIPKILSYAETFNANVEIVSKTVEGPIHRYNYRDMGARARKLANALTKLGIEEGDKIGTIAWNGFRHMEIYYGVPSMGAVYHTINPRLSPEQLIYVINHSEDKFICVEAMFLPLLELIWDKLDNVEAAIVLVDKENMPQSEKINLLCYEKLLEVETDEYTWPEIDENRACGICYTSGTTGNPKGVVYSHRAIVLQAMATVIGTGINSDDILLPVVPMFHVNGWTIPFVSAVLGAKIVLPGKDLDGANIWQIMEDEKVTFSAGVPTLCLMLLSYMKEAGKTFTYFKKMTLGGAAAPRSMLEALESLGVEPQHAWGMTETTSMGTSPSIPSKIVERGPEALMKARMSQGRGTFGAELKIIDEQGNSLPHDGKSSGNLCVRGWGVSKAYLKGESTKEFLEDGWFDTGDIAVIDEDGFMRITDRAKDIIKSGGEWISSIDLENAAMSHPDVLEAAVIGIPHPKWDERPLLIVVKTPDSDPKTEDILASLEGKVAKWWIPSDLAFVESLPHGATGKVSKLELRETFKDYQLSK